MMSGHQKAAENNKDRYMYISCNDDGYWLNLSTGEGLKACIKLTSNSQLVNRVLSDMCSCIGEREI